MGISSFDRNNWGKVDLKLAFSPHLCPLVIVPRYCSTARRGGHPRGPRTPTGLRLLQSLFSRFLVDAEGVRLCPLHSSSVLPSVPKLFHPLFRCQR